MRKTFICGFAAALALGAGVAFGATSTGVVSAVNLAIESVVYTPSPTFILSPAAGNPGESFGSVTVQANSANGWTLTLDSLNNGNLTDALGTVAIPYALHYNGGAAIDLSASHTSPVVVEDVSTLFGADAPGLVRPLTADIAAADIGGKPAGAYTDTLTFTLTSK